MGIATLVSQTFKPDRGLLRDGAFVTADLGNVKELFFALDVESSCGKTPSADPHAGCCGEGGREIRLYPISTLTGLFVTCSSVRTKATCHTSLFFMSRPPVGFRTVTSGDSRCEIAPIHRILHKILTERRGHQRYTLLRDLRVLNRPRLLEYFA